MFASSRTAGMRGFSASRSAYRFKRWQYRSFFSGPSGQGQSGGSAGFNYKYAVAYQAKDRSDSLYAGLDVDSPTGEDNYFLSARSTSDLYAGVADGVGGWVEHSHDSSAISRELCAAMSEFAMLTKDNRSFTPKQLIDMAYSKIKQEGQVKAGGTTAIVAHFPPSGKLELANLGDSWCGVFRDSKLVFQTKFQTVGFNAPYQLAIIPEDLAKEAARRGSSYIQNKPSDADEYQFQLKSNDVIVLATDGVTDNIATGDMELFLGNNANATDLQQVTQKFVNQVVNLSKDSSFPSVFAQEISKLTGKQYLGGKEDDITVVVVRVD